MKRIGFLSGIIFFMLVALLSWIFWGAGLFDKNQKEITTTTPPEIIQQQEAQTSDADDVTVRVKPKVLSTGQPVVFKLNLDTHSVDLDYELVEQSDLFDNLGNTLKPVSWTGGKGGHHLSGELTFSQLDQKAKIVELVIKDIAGSDRKFKWNL